MIEAEYDMTEEMTKKDMSEVIRINEALIKDHLGEMVRKTVEEALNAMLEAEAESHGCPGEDRCGDCLTAPPKAWHLVAEHIGETLTYYVFSDNRWIKIRINNPLEGVMKEIRRCTRVVGAFPDRYIAASQ